ncbi:WD40 repeat domain-containing protein [Acrocarpospora catenulata]|nr:WD40 repeat domain-containing protein [Acrocarpospora catenulata]
MRQRMTGHLEKATDGRFDRSAQRLITIGGDNTVRVWSTRQATQS